MNVCVECKSEFEAGPRKSGPAPKRCPDCIKAVKAQRRKEATAAGRRDRSKVAKKCSNCGREFFPRLSYLEQATCGRACMGKAARSRPTRLCATCREPLPRESRKRYCKPSCRPSAHFGETTCPCGLHFSRRHPGQKYHDRKCKAQYMYPHRIITDEDYVRIGVPEGTPGRDTTGRMLEHRYVMQEWLGRRLETWETVHHRGVGDKTDNRLENLQLRIGKHGKGTAYACLDCGSERIGPIDLAGE